MQVVEKCGVAFLLVSPEYLASDFIHNWEVEPILQRQQRGNIVVLWAHLRSCMYQHSKIANFQAAHDPSKPLHELSVAARSSALSSICAKLHKAIEDSACKNETLAATQAGSDSARKGSEIRFTLILDGDLKETSPSRLAELLDHLNQLSRSGGLRLVNVEHGSIKLTLMGSIECLENLQLEYLSGELERVTGYIPRALISLGVPEEPVQQYGINQDLQRRLATLSIPASALAKPTLLPASPVTVAVVEDEPGTLALVSKVLRANVQVELSYTCGTAIEMMRWLSENKVDVLLVDLGLPDRPGIDVIRFCRSVQPDCEIMVLSIFGDVTHIVQAFEAGARGYLLKDGTEDELATHVLSLHAGGSPMSPMIASQLLTLWQQSVRKSAVPGLDRKIDLLSPREREVLQLVARGYSYQETGSLLKIAVFTVQEHVRKIYEKLDVKSSHEAKLRAHQLGLLDP